MASPAIFFQKWNCEEISQNAKTYCCYREVKKKKRLQIKINDSDKGKI